MTQANPATHGEHTVERHDNRRLTGIVYLLQILALATGGLTLLLAAGINYAMQKKVAGTWLETHYHWQNKTTWFTLLLAVLGALTLQMAIGSLILLAAVTFLIYRVFRGWTRWNIGQPIEESEL